MLVYQIKSEYEEGCPRPWYSFIYLPRGWTDGKDIYVNLGAFYIDDRDFRLLIQHEIGHNEGKKHTLFGLMSPYGLVRYLTT